MRNLAIFLIILSTILTTFRHVASGQVLQDDNLFVVPVPQVITQEYGVVSLTPQIYYFNTSYSISSVKFAYSMSDGKALVSGMTFVPNSGVFSFYTSPAVVGDWAIIRNVSYANPDGQAITISHVINIQVISNPTPNTLPVIMQDDFTNGLSKWNLISGTAGIQSKLLNIYQNNTLILSQSVFALGNGGVTFAMDLVSGFTSNRGFVLYADSNTFYEFYVIFKDNTPTKIVRTMNGQTKVMLQSNKLSQIHASAMYTFYKIFVELTSDGLTIRMAKLGSHANDYELSLTDNDPTIMQKFKNAQFGFFEKTTGNPIASALKVVKFTVYQGKLIHTRQGLTYYVDQVSGSDQNNGLSSTKAFATLNAAQYRLLPDDTLIVGKGVYRESFYMNALTHPDHLITIKAMEQPSLPTSSSTYSTILDGNLILDNSKAVKVMNSPLVYRFDLKLQASYIYQNGNKFSLAMKPLPYNWEDEYEKTNFLPVTNASTTIGSIAYLIVDDMFKYDPIGNLVSDDYWVGAELFHYYKYGNVILRRRIVSYNAATKTIGVILYQAEAFANVPILTVESYAIANHIGVFSKPGQYYMNGNQIYVSLDQDPKISKVAIEVPALPFGFNMLNVEGVRLQGLRVRHFTSHGIFGSSVGNVQVFNCSAQDNGNNGFSFIYSKGIFIDGGETSFNHNDGINFSSLVYDSIIQNMYVHENNNNGIWVGSGGGALFYVENILIKSNRVGPHTSYRQHPDNIQLAAVHNITLDSNTLIQGGGDQNMWMEQNGLVVFTRNVFVNGPVGVNHAMKIRMFNNVFYNSFIRFQLKQDDTGNSLVSNSVINWSNMYANIVSPTTNSNMMVWSRYPTLVSRIQNYPNISMLTSSDKTEIITAINSVINDTTFIKQFKDYAIPLLSTEYVAYSYWVAITKRGLIDAKTGVFTYSNPTMAIIEEVRGLTRTILDEIVFNSIVDCAMIGYFPRTVSIKNNVYLETPIQSPDPNYSILPYWDMDYNYVGNSNSFQYGQWKPLIASNSIFENNIKNATLYFTNYTKFDFTLRCFDSNVTTLIDKGANVGMSYFGKGPDIGAFEMDCNGEGTPITPKPSPTPSPKSSSIIPVGKSPQSSGRISSASRILIDGLSIIMLTLAVFCI